MSDDEIRTAQLPVERCGPEHDPGQPRDEELEQERGAEEHRGLELDLPAPHRREPVEDLDPGRDRDGHRRQDEEGVGGRAHPDGEHVVCPHAHADESDGHGRGDHHRVTEDRLAGEDRNDLGRDRKRRNDEHVDFRVAEDPEEVHPDDGGSTRLRIEEVRAEVAIEQQHDLRRGQRADGEDHQGRHGEVEPGQQRHLAERHPPAAHGEDGGEDIDGRPDATETGDQERDGPIVGAVPGRKGLRRQRGVREPAHVRSGSHSVQAEPAHEAEVEEQPAERRHPEAEGVQPRERHVPRSDHERDQIVREAEHERHHHEEDHRGAVHREHLVEDLRRHEGAVRPGELDPHHRGFDSADGEERQRVADVEEPYPFVVDRREPTLERVGEWTAHGRGRGSGQREGIAARHAVLLDLSAGSPCRR